MLLTGGGVSEANLDERQKNIARTISSPRVFLVVNAEDKSGEDNYKRMRADIDDGDRMVILGTWWTFTTRSYRSFEKGVTSIYIPFGSLNFAERHASPMELVNRPAQIRLRDRANATCSDGSLAASVAYQYGLRDTARLHLKAEAEREGFWDALNHVLKRTRGTPGVALSSSNGNLNSGCSPSESFKRLFDGPERSRTKRRVANNRHTYNYDQSVRRYSFFKATIAMEHILEDKAELKRKSVARGYITVILCFLLG